MTGPEESLASGRLVLAFACMLLVSGVGNTFPVLFPALLAEFGGSRAATAGVVALLWTGGALVGPVGGWLVSSRDPRRVVGAGLGLAALGFGLGAFAPSLGLFTVAVGVGVGLGIGLTGMVVQAAVLADAYVRRRGAAMGIAFAGSMAGFVLALPVQWVLDAAGWRVALAGYAALVLALVPLAWRTLPSRLGAGAARARPAAPAPDVPTRRIVRSRAFWALLVLFAMPPLLGALVTTQHALYFTARGFSAVEASALLAVGGVLATSGRILFGLMADRLGGPIAGFVSFGFTGTGLGCLLALEAWPARALAWAYVLFLFLSMGSRATIVSVLVGRIASPARYGVVFGLIGIGNSLGAAVGPVLSGALYDWTGSYRVVYLAAVGVLAVALTALSAFCLWTRDPAAAPAGPSAAGA